MSNRLRASDFEDGEIFDAFELQSSGSTSYRTGVSITSTTTGTQEVVVSGALKGLSVPTDVPSEVGDILIITGSAAAGTYHIASIVNDTTLTVVEAIVTSAGGSAEFKHKSGAFRVGFDPTGLVSTTATNVQDALKDVALNSSGISATLHSQLLQLIHFIDQGPAKGFVTGATRSVTGTVFPSQILWRRSDATKLVEKNLTYTGAFPTTIQWKLYDNDGSTVLETVTDTITYSGAFETSRTRAIV